MTRTHLQSRLRRVGSRLGMTIAVLLAVGLVTIGGSTVSASSSSAALSKDAGVFISPAASSTVSGRVTWQVGAITSSVYQVDFSIDGGPVTWSEWQSPYMYNGDGGTLDTTTLGEGAHTLEVVEYDSAGRVLGTAEEVVTVDNQPAPPPPPTTTTTPTTTRPRRPAAGGTVAARRARARRPPHRRPRPPRPRRPRRPPRRPRRPHRRPRPPRPPRPRRANRHRDPDRARTRCRTSRHRRSARHGRS